MSEFSDLQKSTIRLINRIRKEREAKTLRSKVKRFVRKLLRRK